MASFWSDRLVEWIAGTTDVTNDIPAMTTESFQQAVTKEGKSFIHYITNNDLANTAYQRVYVKTPATGSVKMSVSSITLVQQATNPNARALARLNIYEGSTVSNVGGTTGLISANLNRTSANALATTVRTAPTITTAGTQITDSLIIAGISTVRDDLILKPDTVYVLELQNISGGASYLSWNFLTYELDN